MTSRSDGPPIILLDIETAPLGWDEPGAPGSLFERALVDAVRAAENDEPPGNYKSDDAIARWRSDRRARVDTDAMSTYEKHSLHAHACQITTVVCAQYGYEGYAAFHDPHDERAVLGALREYLGRLVAGSPHRPWVVAWRGKTFDFPILAHRLAARGYGKLGAHFWTVHYGVERQLNMRRAALQLIDAVDLYPRAWGDKTRLRDLDTDAMRSLDPLEGDGGRVLPALLAGRDDHVLQHCIVDVDQRLRGVWDVVAELLPARL